MTKRKFKDPNVASVTLYRAPYTARYPIPNLASAMSSIPAPSAVDSDKRLRITW